MASPSQLKALVSEVEDLKTRYREGKVGDVEVKQKLSRCLNNFLEPIRDRRSDIVAQSGYVEHVIYEGTQRVQEIAHKTVTDMKKAMGLAGLWNRISRKGRDYAKKVAPSS